VTENRNCFNSTAQPAKHLAHGDKLDFAYAPVIADVQFVEL